MMFAIHMACFEGELVICLGLRGSWCFSVYIVYFAFSIAFASYSPKSLGFTCYTALYLLDYAYHCARMSSNEM
jgi:hypothetical protein